MKKQLKRYMIYTINSINNKSTIKALPLIYLELTRNKLYNDKYNYMNKKEFIKTYNKIYKKEQKTYFEFLDLENK